MLTLKKVKELVEAPSHAKRTPSPRMLFEEGIVLLRREFDHGSHLTVYNSGYVLFSAGKRNTVFHIHDCCGDYAYDAAEGKGDVIEEEYFENCEWHIRALFEGERKMEDNQAKCEDAGRSNVCVSYHALSEDWSEVADRTINMLEKIIENEAVHAMLAVLTDKQRDLIHQQFVLGKPNYLSTKEKSWTAPDIVLHKRTNDDDNIFCCGMKKDSKPGKYDAAKVRSLIHHRHYKFGVDLYKINENVAKMTVYYLKEGYKRCQKEEYFFNRKTNRIEPLKA